MQSMSATLVGRRLQTFPPAVQASQQRVQYVGLRCPYCTVHLTSMAYHALGQTHPALECCECSAVLEQERGVWLALPQNRRVHFLRFIQNYETVRKAEGREHDDPNFYLSLPYCNRTERNSWQWAIRARTYNFIARRILPAVQGAGRQPLVVLDLGAGNAWMSHRLASLGHRPIAVDLQTNSWDGLGAAVHYQQSLPMLVPRFQAELDRLPFENGQFDCAIFNASFHYSENYDRTLAEAIRCLRPGGTIVIADTPSYTQEEWGQRMLEERRTLFQERYGFPSDGLASCEYLTKERLLVLEARHDVEWTAHEVWYGFRWACRPLIAKLRGRREPSQFKIYTARVKAS
jgi:SAM-dependent methyltransferase